MQGDRLCPELTEAASLTAVRWQGAPGCQGWHRAGSWESQGYRARRRIRAWQGVPLASPRCEKEAVFCQPWARALENTCTWLVVLGYGKGGLWRL